MINDYFITTSVSMICIVFTGIVMILFLLKKEMKKITAKLFFALIILGLISMFSYLIAGFYAPVNPKISTILGRILCFTIQTFQWFFMFYMLYIFMTPEQEENFKKNHQKKVLAIGVIITIVDALLCGFLSFNFEQKAPGLPYGLTGVLSTYTNGVYGLALAISIILVFKYRKQMDLLSKILFMFSVYIWLVTFILETLSHQPINDMPATQTLFILFLYLSIENQDQAILEEYQRRKMESEKINKIKNNFIMNMSHQLKTPINTILGLSELLILEQNTATLDNLKKDSQQINESSKKLSDLINSVNEISKLKSNVNTVNEEEYLLENIVYEIKDNISSKITKKELMFYIDVNNEIPNNLYGDYTKILNIVSYILELSIEYTNYGSVKLEINSNMIDQNNHEFIFHIFNTGHAMKLEIYNTTFEDIIEFKEEKTTINSNILKLSIAKSLIEILGGKIEFINEPGKGTQYIIKIKQKILNSEKIGNINNRLQTNTLSQNVYDFLSKKVLIIDEDIENANILYSFLENYNLKIDIILELNKAIEMLKHENYIAVFVNYNMKQMDGKTIIRFMRHVLYKMPIMIAINPSLSKYKTSEIKENGYDEVINVPISSKKINNCMEKLYIESNK